MFPNIPDVLIFVGHGTGGSTAKRLVAILERHGVSVTLSDHLDDAEMPAKLIIVPGGASVQQGNALGPEKLKKIRSFVSSGGSYLGICAGAMLGCDPVCKGQQHTLGLLPVKPLKKTLKHEARGKLSLDTVHGRVDHCWFHNGPFWCSEDLPTTVEAWATVVEAEKGFQPAVLGRRLVRKVAIVAGEFGKGKVILCGPHPEASLDEITWTLLIAPLLLE